MKLTSIQQEIVNTRGNLIVRASAGTGKTHTMVTKISQELGENKTHKVIAAITFTIKAAQEIKNRLSVDITQHFIGTNNSFAIEEIIKPFIKDVYGTDFDVEMDTDYSNLIVTFSQGLDEIKLKRILSSYEDNTKNFIFKLAKKIIISSEACRLYLTSKYFKIYIDEYQDCDKDMHDLFMYLCDELNISMFIVGDEKQSIYIWRGAYPEAFKSIWDKENFVSKVLVDNFRSCQQIQNYTNILCEETRDLYKQTDGLDNIIWIDVDGTVPWEDRVLNYLDFQKEFAVLRFSNRNAQDAAKLLTDKGVECIFIPQLPIADISTEVAWLYTAIAQYCILEHYSVYNLVSEIPVESDESKKNINKIGKYLVDIKNTINNQEKADFDAKVNELAEYLNYSTREDHLEKLYETVLNNEFHVAFEAEKYKHVAITFHSSKGLEFDQVIIFAEDYRLNDMCSIYNHYVASSRAKDKLIIIKTTNYNARYFEDNLRMIMRETNIEFSNLFNRV